MTDDVPAAPITTFTTDPDPPTLWIVIVIGGLAALVWTIGIALYIHGVTS